MKKLKVNRVAGGFMLDNELITSDAHLIEVMGHYKTNLVQVTNKNNKHTFRISHDPDKRLVNVAADKTSPISHVLLFNS